MNPICLLILISILCNGENISRKENCYYCPDYSRMIEGYEKDAAKLCWDLCEKEDELDFLLALWPE